MGLPHQEFHIFFASQALRRTPRGAVAPQLWHWIAAERPHDKRLLDVGCGSGRLTLRVAPLVSEIIGVDQDTDALAEGRRQASQAGLTNVRFIVGDVEGPPYAELVAGRAIDMVVANLCMSYAIITRAQALLPVGGCLIFAALHTAQWQETGRPSRFAFEAEELRAALDTNGWQCEAMEIDTEVVHFTDVEGLERFFPDQALRSRWQQDGRWHRLVHHIATGGARLTWRSHLLVKARKRPPC